MTEIPEGTIRIVLCLDDERTLFRNNYKWRYRVEEFTSGEWQHPFVSLYTAMWGVVSTRHKALRQAFKAAEFLYNLRNNQKTFEELREESMYIQIYDPNREPPE